MFHRETGLPGRVCNLAADLENRYVLALGIAFCHYHFALHPCRSIAMVMFWVSLLAISILRYVLDGVDPGVGLLFGLARC